MGRDSCRLSLKLIPTDTAMQHTAQVRLTVYSRRIVSSVNT